MSDARREPRVGFTKTLAQWIADLGYESLPPEVTLWVKAAVTDYLAVALAGCARTWARW